MGIEVAASWQSLSGVGGNWSLKIPRIITDGNAHTDLIEALRVSTVIGVQQVMEKYMIQGIDLLLSTGDATGPKSRYQLSVTY